MEITCYDNLAGAVIEQAVVDYKSNLLKNKQLEKEDGEETPRIQANCKKHIRDLEKFFKSEWYNMLAFLCDVKIPGREIIAAVKGTVEKEAKICANGTNKN